MRRRATMTKDEKIAQLEAILEFLGVEIFEDGSFAYKPSAFDKWVKLKRDEEFRSMERELGYRILSSVADYLITQYSVLESDALQQINLAMGRIIREGNDEV
jgi:hypothetical protein